MDYKILDWADIKTTAMAYMKDKGYYPNSYAIDAIFHQWQKMKTPLFELLRTSKYWNKDELRIELPVEIKRQANTEVQRDFIQWCRDRLYHIFRQKYEIRTQFFTYEELRNMRSRLEDRMYSTEKGNEYNAIVEDYNRIDKKIRELQANDITYYYDPDDYDARFWISTKVNAKLHEAMDTLACLTYDLSTIDEKYIEINDGFIYTEIKPVVGQKITRFALKVCKELGLDKVKVPIEKRWTDENGVEHSRIKDEGFEYQFARYTDSIIEKVFDDTLMISINPIDYWSMSDGTSWSSCYRLGGEYCAGTTSYLLDGTTMIVYTENEDDRLVKNKRAVFCYGEDKLFMNRLYPDGRDGGFKSLRYQWGDAVRSHILELLGKNKDDFEKICVDDYYYWDGRGYNDFYHASETEAWMLGGAANENNIMIATMPICIESGEYYDSDEDIVDRETNEDEYVCDRCGRVIDEYDCIEIDGYYYCDEDCANEDGWVYTEDTDRWNRDYNCYYTQDTGRYFEYSSNLHQTIYGDYFEECPDDYDSDYVFAQDESMWARQYECIYDSYEEAWFYDYDEDEIIRTDNGKTYLNKENAIADGYEEEVA